MPARSARSWDLRASSSAGSAAGMPSIADSRDFSARLIRSQLASTPLGTVDDDRSWPSGANTCGWRA